MIKNGNVSLKKANLKRLQRILKAIILFLVLGCYSAFASTSYSQTANLSLKINNKALKDALSEIEKNSEYVFFYYDNVVDLSRSVSVDVVDKTIYEVLDVLFVDTNNTYKVIDRQVTISEKAKVQGPSSVHQSKKQRVTGVVLDDLNEPLVGVSIRIKERPSVGTATDINGKYLIDVNLNETLEFIYVGFKNQFVSVAGKEVVDVVMSMNDEILSEVEVVGYGVQKKISIIGSQQTITAQDVKVPVRNLTNSLGGRIAGLVSVQRSGEPGSDNASIYIRGISTLTASMSAPLTLVDGVPRTFSDVDPEDIESFTILKDASATAVYGVRGANGVIIITTKAGKAGKPKFNVRYTEGITTPTRMVDFADAPTYMEMSNEASMTRGRGSIYSDHDIQMTRSGADPYLYPNVDWFDLIFKKRSHNRTANVNIQGGSDMATYYIGLGYYGEEGLYNTTKKVSNGYDANSYYKRYSVTSNITLTPFKTTEIKLGIQGYLANVNYPGSSQSAIFDKAFFVTPNYVAPMYPDGKMGDRLSGSTSDNPFALLNQTGYANQWRNQLFSNLRVTQKLPFLKGLSATGMFSFDAYNYTSNRFTKKPDTWQAIGRNADGELMLTQTKIGTETLSYGNNSKGNRNVYLEAGLNYNNTFGLHDVSGMLLFNQSDEIDTKAEIVEEALPYRFRGLAGRFAYAFDNRYFTEANFGYNGSENFAPDNRYGFFPSFGVGWVLTNEKFMKSVTPYVQHIKLRGSYGKVGNSKITGRRFAYLATVDSKKNSDTNGYLFGKGMDQRFDSKEIGHYAVDVTWETAKKGNIGIDIMTLDNTLNIQLDFFKEEREGIFLTRSNIPSYVGMINNPLGNIGKVNNKGFEFSANYNKSWGDLHLSLLGNFSFNRNKVIEDDRPWSYPWQYRVGQKVSQRFGYVALGLFESDEEVVASPYQSQNTQAGDIKYKDLNGDGKIDDYDKVPIGWGSIPEIMYGFGFTVAYKNVSVSTLFQGAANVDAMLSGEGMMPFSQGLSRGNLMSNIGDRWTEDNPSQNVFYPRLMDGNLNMNYEPSTWWMKNTGYVRMKNLEVAYRLPKSLIKKAHINNASIFFQGVNLFTISPFKLWDVELGDGKGASYPNLSSYSLGINFSF